MSQMLEFSSFYSPLRLCNFVKAPVSFRLALTESEGRSLKGAFCPLRSLFICLCVASVQRVKN